MSKGGEKRQNEYYKNKMSANQIRSKIKALLLTKINQIRQFYNDVVTIFKLTT